MYTNIHKIYVYITYVVTVVYISFKGNWLLKQKKNVVYYTYMSKKAWQQKARRGEMVHTVVKFLHHLWRGVMSKGDRVKIYHER